MNNGYVILDFSKKENLLDRFNNLRKSGKPILAVNVNSKYYDTDTYQFVDVFKNKSFFLPIPNTITNNGCIFNLSYQIKGTAENPLIALGDRLSITKDNYSIIRSA